MQGLPLVGVGADWLSAWDLPIREGRAAALPGEVVVGATAARRLGLAPGDRVQADPDDLYNLGGPVPLPLTVVGVLQGSPLPEDGALLTPVQTLWALDGALHGHAEAATGADPWSALHLHGDVDEQPISAFVLRPASPRARDLLLAEVDALPDRMAVQPGSLWATLVEAATLPRRLALAWLGAASVALLALTGVVLDLSQRSRAPTLALLRALGGGPGLIRGLFALELALLALLGAGMAGLGLAGVALLLRVAEATP